MLLFRVPTVSLFHLSLIVFLALQVNLKRSRYGQKRHALRLQEVQSLRCSGSRAIDGVDLDAMARGGDVKVEVPESLLLA